MFNLPWYSWLNVLGLPVLWALLYVDYAVFAKSKWVNQYATVAIAASVVTIVLYWNPAINVLLTPLQYGLIALVLPMTVWHVSLSVTELVSAAVACLRVGRGESANECPPESVPRFNIEDDDIDLDAGELQSDCQTPRIGAAVSNLFSSNASLKSNIESVAVLSGIDLEEKNSEADFVAQLVQSLLVVLLLVPPTLMSFKLV